MHLLIERVENRQYRVTCETVPGLVAQGRTATETVEIAQDVARNLIESCLDHGDPVRTACGPSMRMSSSWMSRWALDGTSGRLHVPADRPEAAATGVRVRPTGAGKPRDLVEPGHPAANHDSELLGALRKERWRQFGRQALRPMSSWNRRPRRKLAPEVSRAAAHGNVTRLCEGLP